MKRNYEYPGVPTRIVDGDTFLARVDLGFRVSTEIEVRLHGVNTPEGIAGHPARDFLEQLLFPFDQGVGKHAADLWIVSYKDKRSFTRWVCDVSRVEPDGALTNVVARIIAAGYGKPFGDKDQWSRDG